jgi:hypothetical protein
MHQEIRQMATSSPTTQLPKECLGVIDCMSRLNGHLLLLQRVAILSDGSCVVFRPPEWWGVAAQVNEVVQLPFGLFQGVVEDITARRFADHINGAPAVIYWRNVARTLGSIPGGALDTIRFVDDKFGMHFTAVKSE